ncbi:MAG: TlyA family RNA methyltransferase [Clostridia bacterium]|nr:TlyA family RNA methyltransferase [Clostridia bacterium]
MKDRIDNILVKKGYFSSRQKAQYAIENRCVLVEGRLVEKAGKQIDEECNIEVKGEVLPFVSRGGLKLDKAIKSFKINLQEKVCMDIGASTGGFTDCMLQNGAKKVYAVDVGHNQLAESLKENEKVVNLEGTNIREIKIDEFEKVDFISIDVSFISLTQVLDKAYELLKEKGETVTLIKPQFEAGKEFINKNGVVKDKKVHAKVIEKIMLLASSLQFEIIGLDYSPIKGPAGNIEYLLYLKKNKSNFELFSIREKVKQIVEIAHKELKKKE